VRLADVLQGPALAEVVAVEVAGPDAVDGLAPGTVCLGVAGPDGTISVQERFDGDRAEVRRQTVVRAFDLLSQAWAR